MIAFEVHLNGEKLCTAGIENAGVITAILSWVSREDTDLPDRDTPMDEELTFSVGGLLSDMNDGNEYLKWASGNLQIGDQVVINVVDVETADEPFERVKEDPDFLAQQERKYYERLKQDYEE